MVTFKGQRSGKFLIEESDKDVLLKFEGPDAGEFRQVNPPATGTPVVFSLTLKYLADTRFLETTQKVWQAVEHNDGEWSIVSLPRKTYDTLLKTVWENLTTEAAANGGRITKDFDIGSGFDTEIEAAVAVSIATRALAVAAKQQRRSCRQGRRTQ